jgi:hypothetical protein
MTARELADRVVVSQRAVWDNSKSDPRTAIVATEQLGPEDEQAVRRAVADAGYRGREYEEKVRHVTELVIGRVEALADDMPATGAD